MQIDSSSRPLVILVATEDRPLQRQLSKFFDMLGNPVLQAFEPRAVRAAVQAKSPHVAILGTDLAARSDWELCRWLTDEPSSCGIFKFLLIEESAGCQLQEALEAGIDDFLRQPICYGELLSRLRAAARVLEFDRRVGQQSRVESVTGLPSRSAFVKLLRCQMTHADGAACVVLDIDFFSRFPRLQGVDTGDALLEAVARELTSLVGEATAIGCLGGDRFAAVLPAADPAAAARWAERVRLALVAAEFRVGDTVSSITASFGAAAGRENENAEQLIERATQALQIAKSSGRDCVVQAGEFAATSPELSVPGKLFERTVARDVMTPCTAFLHPQETVSQAVDLFHRTRLDAIPVVDPEGKLLGLCELSQIATINEADGRRQLVREAMNATVQSFGEQDNLALLLEHLAGSPQSPVLIVKAHKPLGLVTNDSLLAMSLQVTTGSFAAEPQFSHTSDYLLVPDLCREPSGDTT